MKYIMDNQPIITEKIEVKPITKIIDTLPCSENGVMYC